MSLFENTDLDIVPSPESSTPVRKFKLGVEDAGASFVREFATVKSMKQYLHRNPCINATPYILNNNKWERFVIYGSQVIPKTTLENLLKSIN